MAEIAGEYLKKGSKVYLEGALRTRKWQDKSGQDRYTTEIVAGEMQMLDSRASIQGDGGLHPKELEGSNEISASAKDSSTLEDLDDIPF